MILLLWLLETVFLDDFYRFQVTYSMRSASGSIAKNIENTNLSKLVYRIAEENNFCILVVDSHFRQIAGAEGQQGCVIHHLGIHDIARLCHNAEEENQIILKEFSLDAFRNQVYDARQFVGRVPSAREEGLKSLISVERVDSADGHSIFIMLNAMVTPVTGTVQTIRWELFFITILLVAAAFLISLFMSRKLSKPISDTTEAARELSAARYTPVEDAGCKEIRVLNDRLAQAALDLQQVDRMQKELVANISHDLRTPLTLMQGYAEVMRDIPGENSPDNAQVIIDETKRLTTLVNAIMDLNAAQRPGQPQEIDLDSQLGAIMERYGKMLEHQGYTIQYNGGKGVKVYADPQRLEQAVCNLLNNALTYTGEDKTVILGITEQADTVRISVTDSGEGIAAEDLPFIWDRYFRGSKPHKRAAVGSGLGLNIVKGILDSEGLPYGVDSTPGKGSTFWFEVRRDCK